MKLKQNIHNWKEKAIDFFFILRNQTQWILIVRSGAGLYIYIKFCRKPTYFHFIYDLKYVVLVILILILFKMYALYTLWKFI